MSPSRRSIVIGAAAVLGLMTAAGAPSSGHASELCKTRRGGLLVRDACKPREQKLDAAALDALGLRGPAGTQGPAGPPGGGLHVVDANGSEVGIVTALENSYYGQHARLLRESGLPGAIGPEFIQFSVSVQGLVTSDYACNSYYGTFFKTPDCAGPRYEQCEYGNCSSVAGAFLFLPVVVGTNGIGCFARGGSEFERGDFFRKSSTFGSSIDQVVAACTDSGGTLLGPVTQCGFNGFCADCCLPARNVGAAPVHEIDLSAVGTPPFQLSR
jgi:hypothetical protein